MLRANHLITTGQPPMFCLVPGFSTTSCTTRRWAARPRRRSRRRRARASWGPSSRGALSRSSTSRIPRLAFYSSHQGPFWYISGNRFLWSCCYVFFIFTFMTKEYPSQNIVKYWFRDSNNRPMSFIYRIFRLNDVYRHNNCSVSSQS